MRRAGRIGVVRAGSSEPVAGPALVPPARRVRTTGARPQRTGMRTRGAGPRMSWASRNGGARSDRSRASQPVLGSRPPPAGTTETPTDLRPGQPELPGQLADGRPLGMPTTDLFLHPAGDATHHNAARLSLAVTGKQDASRSPPCQVHSWISRCAAQELVHKQSLLPLLVRRPTTRVSRMCRSARSAPGSRMADDPDVRWRPVPHPLLPSPAAAREQTRLRRASRFSRARFRQDFSTNP